MSVRFVSAVISASIVLSGAPAAAASAAASTAAYRVVVATADHGQRQVQVRDRATNAITRVLEGDLRGYSLGAAADRSWVAFHDGTSFLEGLEVMRTDGTGRHLAAVAPAGRQFAYPAWSPDGGTIVATAWTEGDDSRSNYLVSIDPAGLREPQRLPNTAGIIRVSFNPTNSNELVGVGMQYVDGESFWGAFRITLTPSVTVTPLWSEYRDRGIPRISYSRDGKQLAYGNTIFPSDLSTDPVEVAPEDFRLEGWTADGTALLGHVPNEDSYDDIAVVSLTGETTILDEVGDSDVRDVEEGAADDRPLAGSLTVTLNGASPRLAWVNAQPATTPRSVVRRSTTTWPKDAIDGVGVYDGAANEIVDTVALATLYFYSVFMLQADGSWLRADRRVVTLSKPSATMPRLASDVQGPTVTVLPRGNPNGALYEIAFADQLRGSARGPFVQYTMTVSNRVTYYRLMTLGERLHARVRARDRFGNGSAWAYAFTDVPYDDSVAKLSGAWSKTSSNAHWMGSYRSTRSAGASATFTVTGSAVVLVGDKCGTCARFRVSIDGRNVGVFSSNAALTQNRALLFSHRFTAPGRHTVVVTNIGATGAPTLRIDAMGVMP